MRVAIRPGRAATRFARTSVPKRNENDGEDRDAPSRHDIDLVGKQVPHDPAKDHAERQTDNHPDAHRDTRLPGDGRRQLPTGEAKRLEESQVTAPATDSCDQEGATQRQRAGPDELKSRGLAARETGGSTRRMPVITDALWPSPRSRHLAPQGLSTLPRCERQTECPGESRKVETTGLEPATSCLQSRCSSQLSYVPVVERTPDTDRSGSARRVLQQLVKLHPLEHRRVGRRQDDRWSNSGVERVLPARGTLARWSPATRPGNRVVGSTRSLP